MVAATFENRALLGTNSLLAWVLMPDHAHWLIQLGAGERLETSIGRLKAVSTRNFNRRLGREGKVWAPAFHDRGLRREEDLRRVARYVVANPVRAGLVWRVGDYPFWNAVWL
ncbi:transposase [Pseudomonas sp. JH-2]|nr:transposase [Pseudomonas sp. JH-2]